MSSGMWCDECTVAAGEGVEVLTCEGCYTKLCSVCLVSHACKDEEVQHVGN